MKLQGKAVDGFLKRPDPKIRAILLYGPDPGLVRDRAAALGAQVIVDFTDPFRVANLSPRAIAADPGALMDEVGAQSLIGGRRLVRVQDAEDAVAPAFALLFEKMPPTDTLVVTEAGDLSGRSRLRSVFENAPHGVAIPCYVEDEGALGRVAVEMLKAQGFTLDDDALSFLTAHLVGNRMIARTEIDKLTLYMASAKSNGQPQTRVKLDDVQACVGDSASLLSLDDPAWAAASGDFAALDRSLNRLYAEGMGPIAVLRMAQRHFQRLHLTSGKIARGMSPDAAVDSLKPPVFYKMRGQFLAQARRWSPPLLLTAIERLVDAEAECKRTNMPDETLCARALFQIAGAVRRT